LEVWRDPLGSVQIDADMNDSFRTQRYFGENVAEVRRTRILERGTEWLDGVIPERGTLLLTNDQVQADGGRSATVEHNSSEQTEISPLGVAADHHTVEQGRPLSVGA
jgi:hypothetical protein